jgi:hypothetical protein
MFIKIGQTYNVLACKICWPSFFFLKAWSTLAKQPMKKTKINNYEQCELRILVGKGGYWIIAQGGPMKVIFSLGCRL